MRHEIRFSGFGDRESSSPPSSLAEQLHFMMINTQSRPRYMALKPGRRFMSAVIIDDEPILFPKVRNPDIYLIMSQQGFEKYGKDPAGDAIMLLDSGLVHDRPSCRWVGIPATLSAKNDLGREIVANIIMLGALTTATTVVSGFALEKAILDSVPNGTEYLNIREMKRGQELGMEKGSS